jgi:hypothetical protein
MAFRSLTLCIHFFPLEQGLRRDVVETLLISMQSESVPLEQGTKMNTQTKTHNGKPPFKQEA